MKERYGNKVKIAEKWIKVKTVSILKSVFSYSFLIFVKIFVNGIKFYVTVNEKLNGT